MALRRRRRTSSDRTRRRTKDTKEMTESLACGGRYGAREALSSAYIEGGAAARAEPGGYRRGGR